MSYVRECIVKRSDYICKIMDNQQLILCYNKNMCNDSSETGGVIQYLFVNIVKALILEDFLAHFQLTPIASPKR